MHLKHACLPISPPEQVLKTSDSILYSDDARKGVSEKKIGGSFSPPPMHFRSYGPISQE